MDMNIWPAQWWCFVRTLSIMFCCIEAVHMTSQSGSVPGWRARLWFLQHQSVENACAFGLILLIYNMPEKCCAVSCTSREIRRREFKKGHMTSNIMMSKWIYGTVMSEIYLYYIPVNSVCAHACKDSSLVYLWYFQSGQEYHGLLLMLTTSIYWHKVDHLHNMLTTSVW